MYGIWLIVYKNIKVKKIETSLVSEIGAVEDFRLPNNVRDEVTKKFNSYWSTNVNNKDYNNTIMLFHIDSSRG
jgi:hypothetical protein